MASKRVTMKDIALEAGVSEATVSYVLNYSQKEKISHETRLRIFEVAKKLNYVPNLSARSLVNQKSALVGIIVDLQEEDVGGKVMQQSQMVFSLENELSKLGYSAVLFSLSNVMNNFSMLKQHFLEAVFLIDIDAAMIKRLTKHLYMPAIFVDCHMGDPLFFEVLSGYEDFFLYIKQKYIERFVVVMDRFGNDYAYRCAIKHFGKHNVFINESHIDLNEHLTRIQPHRIIVLGEFLSMYMERHLSNAPFITLLNSNRPVMLHSDTEKYVIDSDEKARKAIVIMKNLLSLAENDSDEKISFVSFSPYNQ